MRLSAYQTWTVRDLHMKQLQHVQCCTESDGIMATSDQRQDLEMLSSILAAEINPDG